MSVVKIPTVLRPQVGGNKEVELAAHDLLQRLDRLEARLSREARQGSGAVYAAVGAREGNADRDMVRDLEKLGARLGRKRYPLLRAKVEVLEGSVELPAHTAPSSRAKSCPC